MRRLRHTAMDSPTASDSARFFVSRKDWEPSYLALYESGELQRRADEAVAGLAACRACPRACDVDRLADATGVCRTGRYARVASYGAHHGEEDCLRGWRGSGTLFFAMCNLRCVFCQNFDISQGDRFSAAPPEHLAAVMLALQQQGCHNLNLVTPEHVVPQVLEALAPAVAHGLRLPIVYNTSAYDAPESLRLLDGVVDIYMPDFKLWDSQLARRYLKAADYPQVARSAIREMHRQVGPLTLDEEGLARRGVLVRHLIMPGLLEETRSIMQFLAHEISPDTYVNLMDQYYPSGEVSSGNFAELNGRLGREEFSDAMRCAQEAGLWRFDRRGPGLLFHL